MKNRKIQRLFEFCLLGLVVALSVTPIFGQNAPAQTPQTQQPGAPGTMPPTTMGPMSPTTFLSHAIEMNSAEIQLSRMAASKGHDQRVRSFAQMLVKDHLFALEKLQNLQGDAFQASTQIPGKTDDIDTAGTRPTTGATGVPGTTGTPGAPGTPQVGGEAPAMVDQKLPQISDEHQRLMERLNGITGPQFDQEYIDAMVDGHRASIRMYEQQAGITSTSTSSTSATDSHPVGSAHPGNPSTADGPSATEVAALARELLPTLRLHLEQAEQIQMMLK